MSWISCICQAVTISNRGLGYGGREEFDKAIADLTEAIRTMPDLPIAYVKRGEAYYELGNNDKAAADFAKAKELGYEPDDD